MTKVCYAALDIGTSRIKMGVWTSTGIEIIASRACPLERRMDAAIVHWSQLQVIVEELIQSLGDYCTKHAVDDLHLGLCGQVSSILVWDTATDQAIEDVVPIWLDRQSASSVGPVQELFSRQRLQDELSTCLPLACNWLLVKLHAYMAEHAAEIENRSVNFLQLHDAVFHLLSQEFKTHPSAQVSIANNEASQYASGLLADIGLSSDQFPAMSCDGSAKILNAQCQRYGLPAQSRVYVGLADMYAGFNGFFLEAGELLWQCNTSEIFGYCGDASAQEILPRQRLGEQWIYYGSTNSGGQNINWFLEQIAPEYTLDELSKQASQIPAGSEGLLYLPFLSGERAPHWDSQLSSSFIGLQLRHSKAHMFRALLEGVAFNKRHILEFLPEHAQSCKIAGGSSVNELWNEIRAHIIAKPLQRIAETEVAVLGVLRFVAQLNDDQDLLHDLQANLCADLLPLDEALCKDYDHYYQLYSQAQKLLKPLMHELSQELTQQLTHEPQPVSAIKREYCDA